MSIFNKRNALVGFLTLKWLETRRRRKKRNALKYATLGLVSLGIIAGLGAVLVKRQRNGDEQSVGLRLRQRGRRDRGRGRHLQLGAVPGDVSRRLGDVDPSLIRPALAGLVPYEPGRPVEDVQRELGLERVVKLASNEGPYGPFPSAQEAIARAALELNRYPDGGAYRLRQALAERHGVRFEEVAVCAGADAVIGFTVQAALDPGDEVVTGWPSFASYVLDPLKVGAVPVQVPLRDERLDLDAMLDAITERTKLVFISAPNNPTGTTNTRDELDAYFARVPANVLTVLDQAYFEYIDDPDYPDGIEEYAKAGHRVLVLRTFSKIYGLAGLRVGYGVGPAEVMTAIGKVRRAFDVTSVGQEAALASLGDEDGAPAPPQRQPGRDGASRGHAARARLRAGRPSGRELRLRPGERRRGAERGAAAQGRHRAPARRVRRAGRASHHSRNAGRDRVSRRGAVRAPRRPRTRRTVGTLRYPPATGAWGRLSPCERR